MPLFFYNRMPYLLNFTCIGCSCYLFMSCSTPKGTCKSMQQISSDVAKDCVQFWTDLLLGLGSLLSTVCSATVSGFGLCCCLSCLSWYHCYYVCSGPRRFSLRCILRRQRLLQLGRRNGSKAYAKSVVSLWLCISPQCVGTGIF